MTKDMAGPAAAEDQPSGGRAQVLALAMVLAALAGFVDATGYIHFRHIFLSFMSGNSTEAMAALAQGDDGRALVLGEIIALFVAGVTVGELVGALSERWRRPLVLLVQTLLLGVALSVIDLAWGVGWAAAFLAFAMGVQNAAVHKVGGTNVALTYVTGTLVHVGRGIAAAVRGAARWRAILPFLALWGSLVIGGFVGALIADRSFVLALSIAIGASAACLTWTTLVAVLAGRSGVQTRRWK